LASVGRQLHAIVSSDASNWRDGTLQLHRDFCSRIKEDGTAGWASKVEDDAVAAEHARQRMYMERALDSVKARVGRTEAQAQADLHKKLAENQMLLSEVNSLRYEAKALRRKNDQLQTQLIAATAPGAAASALLPASGPASPVPLSAAPHTRPGTASIALSPSRSSSVLTQVPPSTPPPAKLPHPASAATLHRPASAAPAPGRAAGLLLGGSGRPITPSPSRGQLLKGRLSAPPDRHRAHEPPPPPATGQHRLGADVTRLREQVCTLLGSRSH
jgi:hypothetical protein